MWSATRSAMRRDRQRRVYGSRGGQEGGVHHVEVRVVVRPAEHVQRRCRGVRGRSARCRTGAKACACRRDATEHDGEARRLEAFRACASTSLPCALMFDALPSQDDPVAVQPSRGSRGPAGPRSSGTSRSCRRRGRQARHRRPARVGLQDRRGDLAEKLDVAERRAASAVLEVEIVEADGLLVDGVCCAGADRRRASPTNCGS